jgi:4-amino-4-deoxy-L-arabinose transferase-like glycosyltransferase
MLHRPSHKSRYFGFAVFLCLISLYIIPRHISGDLYLPPGIEGDEHDYDTIAFSLTEGFGFSRATHLTKFLEPYIRNRPNNLDDWIKGSITEVHLTTYRPPGLPVVMAATQLLFGRETWPIRVINAVALALAISICCGWIAKISGIASGLVAAFIFATNPTLYYTSVQVMTEPITCLLVVLLAFTLFHRSSPKPLASSVKVGVILGLLILMRTICIAWLPFVLIAHAVIVFKGVEKNYLQAVKYSLIVALGCLVLITPWAVRNCIVLNAFMPFGAQGMIELPKGFSDEAWAAKGVWFPSSPIEFTSPDPTRTYGPDFEREAAKQGQAFILKWIKNNPEKAVVLGVTKIWKTIAPVRFYDSFILIFGWIGLLILIRRPIGWSITAIMIANFAAIAATWTVGYRFLVPVLPLLGTLAAFGFVSVLKILLFQYELVYRASTMEA